MYADMGNDKQTEMPLIFQDSRDPSVFVMTSTVGGPGLNLTTRNHPVVAQKLWELNKQWQACSRVVRLGQNQVPHT